MSRLTKRSAPRVCLPVLAAAVALLAPAGRAHTAEIRQVTLPTADLVYDPHSERLYASIPAGAGAIGDAVVAIDPVRALVDESVAVGGDPATLAVDEEGRFLHVGLDGAGAIARLTLAPLTADLQFSLGSDDIFGALRAEDIAVMPGSPAVIAVSRYLPGSPRHAGVGIYNDGILRPITTPGHSGANVIEFASDPARLYGYNNETTEWGFRRMAVDATGVAVVDVRDGLINDFWVDIAFADGVIYTTSGQAIEPESGTIIGTFALPAPPDYRFDHPVAPDVAANRFYYVADGALLVFDRTTFALVETIAVPAAAGRPTSLVRWGADGLAFRTSAGQVFLVRTSAGPSGPGPCQDVVCDPFAGTCAPVAAPDGRPCNDGDACTTADACRAGVCAGGPARACDDGDPCTDDACDAQAGCTSAPVAGTCWNVAGAFRVRACGPGGCNAQTASFGGVLVLYDGGGYRIPSQSVCPSTQVPSPDEVGTSRPRRGGWLLLEPTNNDALIAAIESCPDVAPLEARIAAKVQKRLRHRVQVRTGGGVFCRWAPVPADGNHLCGRDRSGGSISIRGQRVTFGARWRYAGTRAGGVPTLSAPLAAPAAAVWSVPELAGWLAPLSPSAG
jgi:hypothetical protein